jgi:ABC-type Fe3+/spermidine/putrescine transport system ATPase subunit
MTPFRQERPRAAPRVEPDISLPATGGAQVELIGLSRYYGGVAAVQHLDLRITASELLTVLGPSGSGKTTTLMMIAGFVHPTAGEIRIAARSVTGLPAYRRNIGVVFQSYALFPHMDVFENVSFPLRMRRIATSERQKRTREMLDLVHLSQMEKRRIQQLSGGEQQRVALARALVFRPPLLLMDEPLGALDRKLKEELQLEIKRVQRATGVTVLYVTHDQEEALILSDRIAVMNHGGLEQVGTPREMYERPASAFVAQFMGESNALDGVVESLSDDFAAVALPLYGVVVKCRTTGAQCGARAKVIIRPEALELSPRQFEPPIGNVAEGRVEETVYLGQSIRYLVRVGQAVLTVRAAHRPGNQFFDRGAPVTVSFPTQATALVI